MYFIANWKMYGNLKSLNSIKNVIKISKNKKYSKAKIIYCPPYTLISEFVKKTKNSSIQIGSQNCHHSEEYGAFTGSINAKMIKNIGSKYVIVGHSENRSRGETNKEINKKIISALKENLNVIFCIGETLNEKKKKKTNLVLKNQILNGLKNIRKINNIIFAYEPVWSIGTGIIPKMNDLNYQITTLKKFIKNQFKKSKPILLYGGSVNDKNVQSLKI